MHFLIFMSIALSLVKDLHNENEENQENELSGYILSKNFIQIEFLIKRFSDTLISFIQSRVSNVCFFMQN